MSACQRQELWIASEKAYENEENNDEEDCAKEDEPEFIRVLDSKAGAGELFLG